MAATPRYPSLYQLNTRVYLRRLAGRLGRRASLDDVPDADLDAVAALGVDWVWLLSVWQTGDAGRAVSRANPAWQEEFRTVLPDLREEDICGSGFAITDYSVSAALGGDAALARLRERLAARDLKLMLDHVPNHTALDHAWARERPDFYIGGTNQDVNNAPENWVRVETTSGSAILAYGRDPNFAGWPDTLQLNYASSELQEVRILELLKIADQCDGLRCDMAMLLEPEVFQRTWGLNIAPFWPRAIARVREVHADFLFMAEVYWDMEWQLQQHGFDHCYDKRLYDRLRDGLAGPVRDHLAAGLDYQDKLARFLENHDEPRANAAFPWPVHQAAAIISFLSPGLRFFHEGQFDGWRIRIPTHLCRGPDEPVDAAVRAFYERLLGILRAPGFRDGEWQRIEPRPAGPESTSHQGFVACAWDGVNAARFVVIVNYQDTRGQCRLRLPFADLDGRSWRLADRTGSEVYERDGGELLDPGLYVDLPAWGYNVFEVGEPQ